MLLRPHKSRNNWLIETQYRTLNEVIQLANCPEDILDMSSVGYDGYSVKIFNFSLFLVAILDYIREYYTLAIRIMYLKRF